MPETDPVVFVVDDDPAIRESLKRLFKSVEMEVQAFESAREFVGFKPPDRPCCLVLDVRMPRMSGLDLQRELEARGSMLPIIFITAHGDVPMAVDAMKVGAIDFLQKPFSDQQLLDAVQRAIGLDREARAEREERAAVQNRVDTLTPRELEVFELVVTGMLNKQIAFDLGTSEKTIKVHRGRVMEKMKANSLAQLVKLAAAVGIPGKGKSPEDE